MLDEKCTSVEAHGGQMPFVVAQLLHIVGNDEGCDGCDAHILLGDVKENSVVPGDELNSIRAQKNGQLAEYLLPLIFLRNK